MHKNNRSLPHDTAVDGLMETHSHQSICWTALWNINLRLMSFASLWMQNETATKNDDDLMKNQEREKWMLSPFSPCDSDLNEIQLGAAAVADEGWTANGWRNRERERCDDNVGVFEFNVRQTWMRNYYSQELVASWLWLSFAARHWREQYFSVVVCASLDRVCSFSFSVSLFENVYSIPKWSGQSIWYAISATLGL